MVTTNIHISSLCDLIYIIGTLMWLCTEFCYSKPTGKWIVHYQIFCHVGNGSNFDINSLLKSHFQHTKIFQNTIHDIVPLMCTSCKKFINDQLLTLNKEVCNEIWKCIYRKNCHLTLTHDLGLHNFLIIIESGSLSYWIQHKNFYIRGKSHALIIFWKLPLILAAKQLDYCSECTLCLVFTGGEYCLIALVNVLTTNILCIWGCCGWKPRYWVSMGSYVIDESPWTCLEIALF